MNILSVVTSKYGDPLSDGWQPDVRHTVSFLRRHGIPVTLVYVPVLRDPAALVERVDGEPDVVCFDMEPENRAHVLRFLQPLRRVWQRAQILVSGIAATLSAPELLAEHEAIDFVVVGEREQALLTVCKRLQAGGSLRDVAGIYARDFQNPPGPVMADLEPLGTMAHDGLAEMLEGIPPANRVGYLIGSRGCYLHCSFCCVSAYNDRLAGKNWRGRSVRAVVDELEELTHKFALRAFAFQDDCFFGPGRAGQARAAEIAREILRRGLHIQYFVCCTLHDIRRDTLELLMASGLRRIGMSVESLNDHSQKLIGKGIKVKDIYPTLELIEDLELQCEVNLIFFEPTMDLQAVRANLAFFEYIRRKRYITYSDAFPFNELEPYAWSRAATLLRQDGLLNEDRLTCRYADPRVGQLAAFVGHLRHYMPAIFKRRVPFFGDSVLSQFGSERQTLARLGRGLRDWVSLTLLPRVITDACDLVERGGPDVGEALLDLEERFQQRMVALEQRVQQAFQTATATCGTYVADAQHPLLS